MSLDANKTDPVLGQIIESHLTNLGINTPMVIYERRDKKLMIERAFTNMMDTLGLDLRDDSLSGTPKRIAKMYVDELFWGLSSDNFPKMTTIENKMRYDEMVLERDITVMSTCEHHFATIHGKAHVAYIPDRLVLGLSKMNRVVEYFSRRPQVQERLTEQVYEALSFILKTRDVAVVIEAEHFCVKSRGVEDPCSNTVTSKLGGKFKEGPALRSEFMNLITKR